MFRPLFVLLLLTSAAAAQVYTDASAPVERRVDDLLKRMTLEEKVEMLSGTGFASKPLARLGIPSLEMADGPVGVRWQPSVAFPASVMLAATFDTVLAGRYGWALARETKAKGRNTILGPCVNIHRVPHGGRNFESFGEDPFLAARMAVSYVKGVQGEGVVATVKHFAVNNQETDRMFIDARVDERTLHEIYFPAFKAAVQEAKAQAVMCAYNKLNGTYCSENAMLLNRVLKEGWKFDGLVMSDWGAVHSTEGVAVNGLDLEMPDGAFLGAGKLLPLVREGRVKETVIDDKVRRMLRVMFRMGRFDRPLDTPSVNAPEHRAVALDVAREGIVLLKNERALLPVAPLRYRSVAVLGPNAERLRTGGGGSSMVEPASVESPLDGIRRTFAGAEVRFAAGVRLTGDVPPIDPKYFFLPGDSLGRRGVRAEYFANKGLSGPPVLRRVDPSISFRWGGGAPAEGIGPDGFSVRWTALLRPDASGTYELTTASDDGIRVTVDGKRVIDHWNDHGVEARTAAVELTAGRYHELIVEYYENGGDAVAMLGWTAPGQDELAAAVEAARRSELAVIFAGNSHHQESEGFDRPEIGLPAAQVRLITDVATVNPNTVVVLHSGAPVTMLPWVENVAAVVWAFFPGQEGTQALIDVLTGVHNPSGKLPFTVGRRWEDYPAYGRYPGSDSTVEYSEGVMVGYRHFDAKEIEPLYPFGFGLSYTRFGLSDLAVTKKKNGAAEVTVKVTNTGAVTGTEVVQLYVRDRRPAVVRPPKELKAFARVSLDPGETKSVRLLLDRSSFEYYDAVRHSWSRSKGGYTIMAGTSSRHIILQRDIQ